MYQLIWVRKLVLIFGNTTYATSAILTAFMGGLALGSYLIGKYADRILKPLRYYGYLEFGIGASALAILFFFIPVSDAIYVWLARTIGSHIVVFNIVRFLFSIIILIVPTTLMGGTLPVISKFFIQQSDEFGGRIGRLYGFNTLGAVLGAFMTGFFLISWLGVDRTYWIAIILNIVVGIAAYLLSGSGMDQVSELDGTEKKRSKIKAAADGADTAISQYPSRTAKTVLWLFGVAGFVSLAYEVVWTRSLIFFVSSTTYSFTIILTTFLVGIALGSFIMSRFVDRLKGLIVWFGLFELIIAIAAISSIYLFRNMSSIQYTLLSIFSGENWNQVSIFLYITAFIILILPTMCMGAVFPIVNRIYVENIRKIGYGVGQVYMSNTIGAILGSFMSGFVILPLLGMSGSILFLAILNLAVGLIAFFLETQMGVRRSLRLAPPVAAAVIFLAIVVSTFTTKPFFQGTAGFQGTRLLHFKDTASATVSVLEKKDQLNIWGRNVRYLNVNGHNTAHTTYSDMIIHKMLAHLPMLLVPEPKDALVIGFGFGNTCRSFLDYDFVKSVDCVELVAHEKETAEFFRTENEGVFEDERFEFIVNDGRNYVLATEKYYDIVSINSVDPKFSPSLYTEEFYRLCRSRLNGNGQLVAWLPIYGMSLEEVQSLVKSFIEVFPNSSLWYNNPEHLLLCGTKGSFPIDLAQIKERMEMPAVRKSLASIHLEDPYVSLSTFFCGEKMLNTFAGTAVPHTDDFPVVEFSRISTKEMRPAVYEKLLGCRETVLLYSTGFEAFGEFETIRRRVLNYETDMKNMIAAFFNYRMLAPQPGYQEQVGDILEKMRKILHDPPESDFALIQYVDLISHQEMGANLEYFENAIEIAPNFAKAYVLAGLSCMEREELDKARTYFEKAVDINGKYITARMNAGYVYFQDQNWEAARDMFEESISLEPENPFVYSTIAQVYYMLNEYDAAIDHMITAIDKQPEQANLYFNLGRMYQKNNQIPEAIRAFERGIEISPYDQRARQALEELKGSIGD
jgi:spermidine synthase